MMGFVDTLRAEGHAVESICRVLREQGCQIAARTYRSWKSPQRRVAARTLCDAEVVDVVRDLAWVPCPKTCRPKLTPEGLYGRRKMTALVRRRRLPEASAGSVDRAMRALGLSGVRRDKGVRTTIPAKDGKRAGDLLDRDFTAPAPNRVWVTDFTYVRTWSPAWVYVAFIVDVFSQRVVAWHASTSKATDLVMTPLRMAIWQRDYEGNPVVPEDLIHHSDAGSQGDFNRSSQHLDPGGVDGQASGMDDGVDGQGPDEVAGEAVASTGCGEVVLA
jgi:transposase InsO family protein